MKLSYESLKQNLIKNIAKDLPGQAAHARMMVPGRSLYTSIPDTVKRAAVLILIYKKLDRIFISFIKRVSHEADRHSGQIGFPGGKVEPTDNYPIETAVREAHEEIGAPLDVEIIGSLTPLYIPVSGFYVAPILAMYENNFQFSMQASEVSGILEIDISLLLEEDSKSVTDVLVTSGFVLKEVPCYTIQGTTIWGATAMILSELEWVLKQ